MLVYLSLLDTDEDKKHFSILYETYNRQLLYVAVKMLHNQEQAEDCVHETFMRLVKHIDKIDARTYKVLERFRKEQQSGKDIKLTEYLDTLEKEKKMVCYKTWGYLVTILKSIIINFLRKESRFISINDSKDIFTGYGPDMEEEVIRDRELSELKKNIAKLPETYQQVLMLQYFHELSSSEIGQILGKSSDNIRHISKRARDKLRTLMVRGGYLYDELSDKKGF